MVFGHEAYAGDPKLSLVTPDPPPPISKRDGVREVLRVAHEEGSAPGVPVR
jgi:hypothetical protein